MTSWRLLPGAQPYFHRLERTSEDCWTVLWTDLCRVWSESLSGSDIELRCKELNRLTEAPPERLIECIRSSLADIGAVKVGSNEKAELKVVVKTKLAGLPFNWYFTLKEQPPEAVLKEITLPLLTLSKELILRQKQLFQILKRKEAEIEDYRTSGAKVSRKQLETHPFDEQVFRSQNSLIGPEVREEPIQTFDFVTGNLPELYGNIEQALNIPSRNTSAAEDSDVTKIEKPATPEPMPFIKQETIAEPSDIPRTETVMPTLSPAKELLDSKPSKPKKKKLIV